MKTTDYIEHVESLLGEKKIDVSNTAIEILQSRKYFSENLLTKMSKKQALENINILLVDIIKTYEKRAEKSKRKLILRDIDVRPVLIKRFCSLPPICRC